MKPINLFYEEPENDRWLPLDRYPRRIIRRIVRGKPRPGGQMRVFLNLCAGLEKISIPYRINDYRYIQQHPEEIAGIIGKPQVLDKIKWKNPIVFGAAVFSHPSDDPELLNRLPISKILVPGKWMRQMWEPYYGNHVLAWPVGIDTTIWAPVPSDRKDIDILLYDKIRWEHDRYEHELIVPLKSCLEQRGLKIAEIRYGFYQEEDFHSLLGKSKAMIFLCEHETQGIAYQQALSCGVPILAWDRGGFWQDPFYFPDTVEFAPVSSVPYWDERCGVKFKDISEFPSKLEEFLDKLNRQQFAPRDYILENLTLEKCARHYLEIVKEVRESLA
ncbi:MAG TPA: glycosyltransferase [Cyanobacteria bacterium UBA8553]|nr:glycosyltransferase [Cyanobacteria bacterium UBA8553]HAJ61125.1 glycosyltransferase [Cyanobacteria bacterium UBA8543]